MAWSDEQNMFAMYVICTVESNCNWAASNASDAITLGIGQWYGGRAAGLIGRVKESAPDSYAKISERIRNAYESGYSDWTNFFLYQSDRDAWADAAADEENHKVQQAVFLEDLEGYKSTLSSWGVDVDSVKSAIFIMSVYHQSPAAALRIVRNIGGNRTLDEYHNAALNDYVVGQYVNRQNTVYDLLNAWDGTSAPPDFGQTDAPASGGNPDSSGDTQNVIKYVQAVNNQDLIIYGSMTSGGRLLCRYTGNGVWIPVRSSTGTPTQPSTGGGNTGDPADFAAMRALWEQYENQFDYSQAVGRLSPDTTGYTDCSACIWWAANKATDNKYEWLGTSTYTMLTTCIEVSGAVNSDMSLNLDVMQAGDLCICNWSGGSQHVEWYWGNNVLWGAGYAPCPHQTTTDAKNYFVGAVDWVKVMRFL